MCVLLAAASWHACLLGRALANTGVVIKVLAIDMTARDVQAKAKKAGLPWTQAKGYDTFTPVSDFIPKEAVPSPENLNLWLKVSLLVTEGLSMKTSWLHN
jgi:2-keto-4-pentenoate hydratase/2-oxohepta-3-ene-1,7-dioic acid hydratase in catechol pathway